MATINLTNNDDNYSDSNAGNRINAFAGDDLVRGNGGADRIFGGLGDDGLFGGAGNDRLVDRTLGADVGLDSYDRLDGGAGDDLLEVSQANEFGGRLDALGGDGDDRFVVGADVLLVRGGNGEDTIDASSYGGNIFGGAGDDVIDALVPEGAISVEGGDGNDRINLVDLSQVSEVRANGGAGNDTIDGRAASEGRLDGGGGADTILGDLQTLVGGDGADRLVASDGMGTLLVGGSGRDSFVINASPFTGLFGGSNAISGFEPGERINLSAVDASSQTPGNQSFEFIGRGDFTGPGQLRYEELGLNLIVQANTDARNGIEPEYVLRLEEPEANGLLRTDFVL